MSDHFATLDEPRRPWLDPESLKDKFHSNSAAVHPDRVHESEATVRQAAADRYTNLNAAYQCLRDPKSRLQHLIILERGKKPGDTNQLPDDLLRLFSEVGPLLRQADGLIAEKSRTTSPVLKVQLLERALPLLGSINHLLDRLRNRRDQLNLNLQALDAEWIAAGSSGTRKEPLLQAAEQLYHNYGFIDRWLAQLQERAFQLTL